MLLLSILLLMSQAKGVHVECGERPLFEEVTQYSRIIEGTEAKRGEFPWQVSIQSRNIHYCGGSIINKWWILTAAHCVENEIIPTDLSVVMGTNDLSSSSLKVKRVSSIVLHKDFKKLSMDNDIALLLLKSPIQFNDVITPICMPRQAGPTTWHECWVTGWGQTQPKNENSMTDDLMKVPMVLMDWEECSKVFLKLTKNMLCAGYKNKSYDACQGDSGGPLVCSTENEKRWYQVGIISWGRSCGEKDTPGIYTLLENYSLWVQKVMDIEGRPFYAKQKSTPANKQKPRSSQNSQLLEPGRPRLWLLLCLLPSMLA
ncbi:serine protease 55 isoform X1 [Erinaceus europaeus]|uniref:Serine protease 55 isoform X1 n=1 Tax=Erinaceus europaeus TaxID=9365 RepID=A0A1S2ZCP0_ERIEU|nr:serine protease 55 isoform X1 [Erinaceus europaeus]